MLTAIQVAKAGAEAGEKAAAAAVGQQSGYDYYEDEPPKDMDVDPAEMAAAERRLSAAMPFPLQLADPAQLAPAIEAAKHAGVAAPIVAKAEAKLRESLSRQADDELRAAMPYPWQTADPARLGPAIEAAKQAGVADLKVAAAEAKLKEAQETPNRAAFDTYDRNHSGKLDHKELRKALVSLGLSTDSEEAMGVLAKYDEDQSGLMEFDEFQRLCSELSSINLNLPRPATAILSTDTQPLLGKLMSSSDDLPGLLRQEAKKEEKIKGQAAGGEYEYYEDEPLPAAVTAAALAAVPAAVTAAALAAAPAAAAEAGKYDYYEDEPLTVAAPGAAPRQGETGVKPPPAGLPPQPSPGSPAPPLSGSYEYYD